MHLSELSGEVCWQVDVDTVIGSESTLNLAVSKSSLRKSEGSILQKSRSTTAAPALEPQITIHAASALTKCSQSVVSTL